MVLEYLPAAIWHVDSPGHDTKDVSYNALTRQKSTSSSRKQRKGLLSPVARILRSTAGAVNNAVLQIRDGLTEEERLETRKKEERRQVLLLRLKNAQNVEIWQNAASELDVLEDNEAWKLQAESGEFDPVLIQSRLNQLDEARIQCDVERMLYLVRTALARDLGSMGNIRLYKHSYIGTKDLIERYIDSAVETIRALVRISAKSLPQGFDSKDVLEQLVFARQSYGRSALLLSGGATFGMNHVGVLKALFEAKLLPRIISGASAGSIVCSVLCTRTDEEIPDVLKAFPYGDLAVFDEPGNDSGIWERLSRFLTQGAWIDMKHLTRVMQQLLGDMTFQEAYNRTRRILNICVSSASIYELPRLLNYITSPNVMIWSAVAASCSVPILFSPAPILVKNPVTGEHQTWNPTPQHWIDGSVDNDLPMTRLAEMFNVNHFIVSQVNPHVVPFLSKDEEPISESAPSSDTSNDWLSTLTSLAKGEALHRLQVLAELRILPNLVTKAYSVLSQKYSGDITILPAIDYRDLPRMLKNPTADFMIDACLCGERATWPKLSRIRNHVAVELELDTAVHQLRARVAFSPSQADLRRLSTTTNNENLGSPLTKRKRRVSGSNVQAMARDNQEETSPPFVKPSTLPRPQLRHSKSQVAPGHQLLSPISSSPLLQSPPTDLSTLPSNHNSRPSLHLSPPASSTASDSESNPSISFPESSSPTDSSSTSPIPAFLFPNIPAPASAPQSPSQYLPTTIPPFLPTPTAFFTPSTPAASHTPLSLYATTPPSGVTSPNHILSPSQTPLLSPALSMTGLQISPPRSFKAEGAAAEPSSPERRYKRLFHPVAGS